MTHLHGPNLIHLRVERNQGHPPNRLRTFAAAVQGVTCRKSMMTKRHPHSLTVSVLGAVVSIL